MRDTLPHRPWKNESAVVNLDAVRGPGTHWICYKKRGNDVVYFDSFGNLKPPEEVIRYFRDCKIRYNHDSYQSFDAYNCGHLCLKFLYND